MTFNTKLLSSETSFAAGVFFLFIKTQNYSAFPFLNILGAKL